MESFVKDNLVKGFFWGVGFCVAGFLTIIIMHNGKSLIEDALETPLHKIENFEILNSSHRIIKNEFGSSYLVITGDVKSVEFLQLQKINVDVELRDANGGFVDSCYCHKTIEGNSESVPFKITCQETTNLEQFSSYQFSLEGLAK